MNETNGKEAPAMFSVNWEIESFFSLATLFLFASPSSLSLPLVYTLRIINLPTQGYEMRLIDRASDESV